MLVDLIAQIVARGFDRETLIERRSQTFRTATLFIGIILAISAVILVANTIRLTIYAKREMIRTMKLVGATAMFIRAPFLIEGLIKGTLGGVLALALAWIALAVINRFVVQAAYFDVWMGVAGVLAGAFIGVAGSALSVRRYLQRV